MRVLKTINGKPSATVVDFQLSMRAAQYMISGKTLELEYWWIVSEIVWCYNHYKYVNDKWVFSGTYYFPERAV